MIVTLGVPGRIQSDGTKGPRPNGVGRRVLVENLDILTELEAHGVEVGGGGRPRTRVEGLR
jgi:hypothetical protein